MPGCSGFCHIRFSLTSVLQIKTRKIINDRAKISIKSEKTPFWVEYISFWTYFFCHAAKSSCMVVSENKKTKNPHKISVYAGFLMIDLSFPISSYTTGKNDILKVQARGVISPHTSFHP